MKVVTHNTVSVDGAVTGFPLDIGLHYEIVGRFSPSVILVGSRTARTGIEMFVSNVPEETPDDGRHRPVDPEDHRPVWVIVDSGGALQGVLHVLRRGEYASDIVVAVSNSTSVDYRRYLQERGYPTFTCGDHQVDLRALLEAVTGQYQPDIVLTDSGGGLNRALLREGLIDEISLIVAPEVAGAGGQSLFGGLRLASDAVLHLRLSRNETLREGHCWLTYQVVR
jgi:2,5-diamino-6-(ribosylamino)-4(3H)-pyrimidinone 5'-phosphate reductase